MVTTPTDESTQYPSGETSPSFPQFSPTSSSEVAPSAPFAAVVADYWQRAQTFWQVYQKPLILGAVVLVAGMYAYIIVAALLAVLNSLLVVAGLFKLIGFGYSIWFIYRYLLWYRSREELKVRFEQLKTQVLGFANHIVE